MKLVPQNSISTYIFNVLFTIIFLAICVSFCKEEAYADVQATGDEIIVVIDPGHGGENEGTIENGFQEKRMTLITAQAMYDELTLYDNINVHMTRTDDRDLSLKERAEYAKSVDADFLYSIHYNASIKHDLFGSEVWISLETPFNGYGYQFGYIQLGEMQNEGLFLRGIKTRANDNGGDYYGIIREASVLGIPSALIEHGHVDEERDVPFLDTDDKLITMGKADATAVAKYFGLKSDILGVDYSQYPFTLPTLNNNVVVEETLKDETPPDICVINATETDYENGIVKLDINATDYDSMLLYYDYTIDGGETYSPLQPWPESNALKGTYSDTFSLLIEIPDETIPDIHVRAYNIFDAFTESNHLTFLHTFGKKEIETAVVETEEAISDNVPVTSNKTLMSENSLYVNDTMEKEDIKFFTFIIICVILAVTIIMFVLVYQIVRSKKRRKNSRYKR